MSALSGSHVDGMIQGPAIRDHQRGVEISAHCLVEPFTAADAAWLASAKWHALTLWREAGSPDDAVFHIGPFVRVRRVTAIAP